jgi:UDP:flavonoid glycosyltransferase YjiC (YdhE family)
VTKALVRAGLRRLRLGGAPTPDFDIAIVTDFRHPGETGWRVAEEIRLNAVLGYSTALVPLASASVSRKVVHPAVDSCVRSGLATVLDPQDCWIDVGLLVIAAPEVVLDTVPDALPHIRARRAVAVLDTQRADVAERHRVFRAHFGRSLSWTATTANARRALDGAVPVRKDMWRPSISEAHRRRSLVRRQVPVIGRAGAGDASQWSSAADELRAVYGDRRVVVRVMGVPEDGPASGAAEGFAWQCFDLDDVDIGRFIEGLDFFVYYPGERPQQLPVTAIAMALMRGVPVVLPPSLRGEIGPGPIYVPAAQAINIILSTYADADGYAQACAAARAPAGERHGRDQYEYRIWDLQRASDRPVTAPHVTAGRRPARMLFVSENGTGLGHLTRQLAIARRLPDDIEPVFATMSQAMPIVEQMGFAAELMVSHMYSGVQTTEWRRWFEREMDDILDFHRPSVVVLDSNQPHVGLLRAIARRPRCRFVWMRRALWLPTQRIAQLVDKQTMFDLVIEPEELASSKDQGMTTTHRDGVMLVPPITLLNGSELLPREEAALALGLDASRPAVLIQIGSDAHRDPVRLVDAVVAALKRHPELQIVNVDWFISATQMAIWPEVVSLRGFPVSRYYNAFDFTISAAGYNSFHEIIRFAMPAIFVPNAHPYLDDQSARAAFAEESGAALNLGRADASMIGPLVDFMMDEQRRQMFRFNCQRLRRDNGAYHSVELLTGMVG